MRRWIYFLPVAALVSFAGYLGLRSGDLPSDTDIINHYAAAYLAMAPEGALATDCAATPHADPAVRLVVSCSNSSGLTTTYFVGPRGEALPEQQGPSA